MNNNCLRTLLAALQDDYARFPEEAVALAEYPSGVESRIGGLERCLDFLWEGEINRRPGKYLAYLGIERILPMQFRCRVIEANEELHREWCLHRATKGAEGSAKFIVLFRQEFALHWTKFLEWRESMLKEAGLKSNTVASVDAKDDRHLGNECFSLLMKKLEWYYSHMHSEAIDLFWDPMFVEPGILRLNGASTNCGTGQRIRAREDIPAFL